MYPSVPNTFISRLTVRGTTMVQRPAHTRQDGAIGSAMGTSAIARMPSATMGVAGLPLTLGQPNVPLGQIIERS
jgi:hypothetical protein